MIFYIIGTLCYLVIDKVKNKVIGLCINKSVKMIMWHGQWHKQNSCVNQFLDWLLI